MNKHNKSRSSFSGKIGYVLAAAGASVGLGNIWRFPYLAAKYGGGIFLLIYILLALTFGYSMIVAESAIGRIDTKKPGRRFPVVRQIEMAFRRGLDQRHYPDSDRSILLCHRRMGHQISDRIREGQQYPARRGRLFFPGFISNGVSTELCFAVFALLRSPSSTPVCETALNAFPR